MEYELDLNERNGMIRGLADPAHHAARVDEIKRALRAHWQETPRRGPARAGRHGLPVERPVSAPAGR